MFDLQWLYQHIVFSLYKHNSRIWLLQIEAGLVQKQYIAKVVGEFPKDEVFSYLAWINYVAYNHTWYYVE